MRVVFPALLDAFDCGAEDCACRTAQRWAPAGKPLPAGRFPFRAAERAMVRGAARLAKGDDAPAKPANLTGDFPIAAVATPQGAELYFSALCPGVRSVLSANTEAVDLARSEGGWRVALQVFQPADKLKEVPLTAKKSIGWRQFQALRENLLDLIADPSLLVLARLARVAALVDSVVSERWVPGAVTPLTARNFLAFRGYLESRVASVDTEALALAAIALGPLFPELQLADLGSDSLLTALQGDWREDIKAWVAPREQDAVPAVEAWLALRVFAMPLDRDHSLQRAYAELFEGFAVGIRLASALGRARNAASTPASLVACLALAEAWIADSGEALPVWQRPEESHDRGPRMVDVDMTLESIC